MQIPEGLAGQVIQQHGRQSQQQKLRVCEICGCFLSRFDSDNHRLADHFQGRLHTGYKEIREKLAELKKGGFCSEEKTEDRELRGGAHRNEKDFREEPYSRPRDHYRDSDRERDRPSSSRDRDDDRYSRDRGDRDDDRYHRDRDDRYYSSRDRRDNRSDRSRR